MRKIQVLCLAAALMLASCGDNFQREKDMYPDIPVFPDFKGGKLKSKKADDIRLLLNDKFERKSNPYYFNYLVKDSTLYIMTYFTDREFPEIPLDDDYLVDLVIISNDKPVKHFKWTMDDFAINFDVDTNRNVIIGTHKYLANTNFSTYNLVPHIPDDNSPQPATFKTWQSKKLEEIENTDYFKSFDRVIVDSEGNITASVNKGYGYSYSPVYLIYYNMTYKNKLWKTKINYNHLEAPLMWKLGKEIYYVNYHEEDLKSGNRVKQYSIYKIAESLQ